MQIMRQTGILATGCHTRIYGLIRFFSSLSAQDDGKLLRAYSEIYMKFLMYVTQ